MFPDDIQHMEWKTPLGLSLFVLSILIGMHSDSLNSAIPDVLTYIIMVVVWIVGLLTILSRIKDWYISDLHKRVNNHQEINGEGQNS